jgi:hypothetical protein
MTDAGRGAAGRDRIADVLINVLCDKHLHQFGTVAIWGHYP